MEQESESSRSCVAQLDALIPHGTIACESTTEGMQCDVTLTQLQRSRELLLPKAKPLLFALSSEMENGWLEQRGAKGARLGWDPPHPAVGKP